jgi:enoyl-CoA hydratase/carnithine racemase
VHQTLPTLITAVLYVDTMRFTTKVLPSRTANLFVLTLNNPKALHALSLDMMHFFQDILKECYADDSVGALLVKSNTTGMKTKAFCAGGDVKRVYRSCLEEQDSNALGQGKPGLDSAEFFRQEYIVNHMMATATKPQISLWDGIVMGGGVGISVHGKYRIATENTILAMPETNIGLFPDVGSMFWMPKMLPHSVATYMALTGHRLEAADLLYTGIATHYIPSARLDDLESALSTASKSFKPTERAEDFAAPVLMSFHEQPPMDPHDSYLAQERPAIDKVFGILSDRSKGVEDVVESLENSNSDFGRKTAGILNKMSPTSLKVTLEGLRRGKDMSRIGDDLCMEFRMSQACMRIGSDFHDGIRAALVDKDRNPQWQPATLAEVTEQIVESYFLPIEYEWEIPVTKTKISSNL